MIFGAIIELYLCPTREVIGIKIDSTKDFAQHIKEGRFAPVYMLHGAEHRSVERATAALVTAAVGNTDDPFLLTRMDGREGVDPDALSDMAEALPFMAQRKCVVVEDIHPEAMGTGDFGKLEQFLGDPPPTCVTIFTMKSPIGTTPKKKGEDSSPKAKKLIKLCTDKGCVAHFGGATGADATRLARDTAKKLGGEMAAGGAGDRGAGCGGNLHTVTSETHKVCAYAGEGEIKSEHVRAVGITSVEASVFDLSKAILQSNYSVAMDIVARLMFLREAPATVLAVMGGTFVDLYRAKVAGNAKIPPKQAMSDLGYPSNKSFLYTRASDMESRFPQTFLAMAVEEIAQADTKLKTSGVEGRMVLEQVITRLFVLMRETAGGRPRRR